MYKELNHPPTHPPYRDPPVSKKDMEEGLKKLTKYRQQHEAAHEREERLRKIRSHSK